MKNHQTQFSSSSYHHYHPDRTDHEMMETSRNKQQFTSTSSEIKSTLIRQTSFSKYREPEGLQQPLQPVEAPGRKDIHKLHPTDPINLCPKHSPLLPNKELSTKQTENIISPPIEYSPRSKCKHDLIQFDSYHQLPSPPSEEPSKLTRKSSRKQSQHQDEKEIRNISMLQVGNLPVPPPPQYSPRSSTRRRDFDHSSICGLPVPPPPSQLSPKSKHIHWKPGETIATHTMIRQVKPELPTQSFEMKPTNIQGKSNLSPTRLEKFLNQAVSVQSTLAPIRIPKSSLIGLGIHQPLEDKLSLPQISTKEKDESVQNRSRRYSVHGSSVLETLSTNQPDSSPTKTNKKPLSRDASTDSQDLETSLQPQKDKKILSRDASTDSEDLIKFEDKKASPTKSVKPIKPPRSRQSSVEKSDKSDQKPIRSRQSSVEIVEPIQTTSEQDKVTTKPPKYRDPLLKSFSVDESSRLPPFLSTSLFVDTSQTAHYNIAAMVSPSKQLQNTLKPGNGHLYLAPRRSWQDFGIHRPSQPNLDVLLASEEAALSPIWLPKQPLEPVRSPKPKKSNKDPIYAKILTRKDSLSPSNSFTRSKRASHDHKSTEDLSSSIQIIKIKDSLSRSNSFNKSRKDSLASPITPRKKVLSPASSRNASRRSSVEQSSSPKLCRKKSLSPSPSIDRSKPQELIIISSESSSNHQLSPSSSFRSSPKSPRKKNLSLSQSFDKTCQELIIISSPVSPIKKTLSPSSSTNTIRRSSKDSLSSPKSPRKKCLTPSDSLDKLRQTQDLIIISTESPNSDHQTSQSPKSPRKKKSTSRRPSEEIASPKSPRKKSLSPSTSFCSSRRSSKDEMSSPKSPRKKSVSPSSSFMTRKSSRESISTPLPSRKNSLSPSSSFNLSRSSPIPIPSPKRSGCLSRSNSFSTKSKIFSQTLSIEIPSSPQILSRSGSINDNLSPNRQTSLLSPALEAALISEITAKLAGVHSNISPKYSRQSSPRSTCIYASISPQKSVEIPEAHSNLSSRRSSSSCIYATIQNQDFTSLGMNTQKSLDLQNQEGDQTISTSTRNSSELSLEVPEKFYANIAPNKSSNEQDFDSSMPLAMSSQFSLEVPEMQSNSRKSSSSSCGIYANISSIEETSFTCAENQPASTNSPNLPNVQNSSSVIGLRSPIKSPKTSPIQCPIHVEILVRIPKEDNDKPIATKSQATQIP